MRLNIASAVEGCLYSREKVVPGRPSRYSKDRREEVDILSSDVESSSSTKSMLSIHRVYQVWSERLKMPFALSSNRI